MSQATPPSLLNTTDVVALDNETRPKFLALKVVWIKLADFMDIVPRHPHLAGVELRTRDMVLLEFPFGRPAVTGLNGNGNGHGVGVGGTDGAGAGEAVKEEVSPVNGLTNGFR